MNSTNWGMAVDKWARFTSFPSRVLTQASDVRQWVSNVIKYSVRMGFSFQLWFCVGKTQNTAPAGEALLLLTSSQMRKSKNLICIICVHRPASVANSLWFPFCSLRRGDMFLISALDLRRWGRQDR